MSRRSHDPAGTLRVLYVLPRAAIGGAERITQEWIAHHAPDIVPRVVVGGSGPLAGQFAAAGVPVRTLRPWRQRQFLAQAWATAATIRREGIDLVHSSMLSGHLVGGLAAWLTGRPAICFNHGPIGSQWLQGVCPLLPAERVLVPSEHMRREQARTIFNTRRVARVPLGVDARRFAPAEAAARARARRAAGVAEDECVVGIFGRLAPLKGAVPLLRALAAIAPRAPRRLVLLAVGGAGEEAVGGADYAAEFAALAERVRDRVRVVATGHREDVGTLFDATDVVANASVVPETFGLAIAEAMLKERVVAVPDAGALAELVEDGATGFRYPLGDAAGLAAALLRAIAAEPGMGGRARRAIAERYPLEASVRQLEAHYRDAADAGGRNCTHP